MLTFLTGLAAGSAHVVTGPDHLAALAPLAIDRPGRAARTGALWGVGHGAGVVAVATAAQLLREVLPLERLSAWSELLVGFVLLGVGLWALRSATRLVVHAHPHEHSDHGHAHAHVHVHADVRQHSDPAAHRGHSHASFWIGTLHGAAGGGHLLGVLPSLALPPAEAAVYLAAYFLAAVASMTAFGFVVGRLVARSSRRVLRGAMVTASLAAIGIGGVWIVTAWPA